MCFLEVIYMTSNPTKKYADFIGEISSSELQLNEEVIKGQLKELVRGSVEERLNELLEQEAEKLTQAARYERNEARQG